MALIPAAAALPNCTNPTDAPIGPVPANVTPTDADCGQENLYVGSVKRMRLSCGNGAVSNAELGAALIREHMILAKAAGAGAAPAWAAAMLQQMQQMQLQMQQMQLQMQQNHTELVTLIQASSENQRIRIDNAGLGLQHQLRVLVKEKPGLPANPLLNPPNFHPPVFVVAPEVGDHPQQHGLAFPATGADVLRMTRPQVATLSFFYNNDFGIQVNDAALTWATKFGGYIGFVRNQ